MFYHIPPSADAHTEPRLHTRILRRASTNLAKTITIPYFKYAFLCKRVGVWVCLFFFYFPACFHLHIGLARMWKRIRKTHNLADRQGKGREKNVARAGPVPRNATHELQIRVTLGNRNGGKQRGRRGCGKERAAARRSLGCVWVSYRGCRQLNLAPLTLCGD